MSNVGNTGGWLLFFYSVPSRPVSSRMKIWRKLSKAGAVQIKGAVYVLPMSDEHLEFFQWLVAAAVSLGGEAAYTRVAAIDSMPGEEIVALFRARKDAEYAAVRKSLEDLETKAASIRKGSRPQNLKALSDQLAKVSKAYDEAMKTDYFLAKSGAGLRSRLSELQSLAKGLTGASAESKAAAIPARQLRDFQNRTWVTRRRPFIDRMASAWLIRKFIDRNATFAFAGEKELASAQRGSITYDVSNGDFTHTGDLCTFEVLVRSFGIKDRAVRKISEIVHELDIQDDRYGTAEAKGIEKILSGIRAKAADDADALEKGMAIFEMLYVSTV